MASYLDKQNRLCVCLSGNLSVSHNHTRAAMPSFTKYLNSVLRTGRAPMPPGAEFAMWQSWDQYN